VEAFVSEERRFRKRVNLSVYLAATNTASGELMGRIIDLNPAGFLLLTDNEYSPDDTYSINISLPEPVHELLLINCIAVACRHKSSANPAFNEVGFEITFASSETKKIIEEIQQRWHLNFPEK
jgi:hypothetical protein